ncbi:MAG: hypothetical protein ACFE8A_00715 [Candidatus Hodarchaeota archaeon]
MAACDNIEKWYCWNGDEEALINCIRRSKFVKKVRTELMKKKINQKLIN